MRTPFRRPSRKAAAIGLTVVLAVAGVAAWRLMPGKAPIAPDSSIRIDPDPMAFGDQTIGITSGTRTVVVRNFDKSASASIHAVDLRGPGASDFAIVNNICRDVSIPPGQSCTIDLQFTPQSIGLQHASLLIRRADVSRYLTVPLSGTGVVPALRVQQQLIDFGPVAVNATSVTRTIVATNAGSDRLVVRGVALTGTQSHDFKIAEPVGCTNVTLAAGGTCTVGVSFAPTDFGDRTAFVSIAYDGPGSPLVVDLSGVGSTLSLRVAPTYINFARQQVGTASAASLVTISTPAGTVVTIGSVTIDGPNAADFKIMSDTCTGLTLTPRDSCTVGVEFLPAATDARLASVVVTRLNEVTVVSAVQLSGFGFNGK